MTLCRSYSIRRVANDGAMWNGNRSPLRCHWIETTWQASLRCWKTAFRDWMQAADLGFCRSLLGLITRLQPFA